MVAAIAGGRIFVVAFFIAGNDAVAAHLGMAAVTRTGPSGFRLAFVRTAVSRNIVAVFAILNAFDDAVAAFSNMPE